LAAAAELGGVFSEMKLSFMPLYWRHLSVLRRSRRVGPRYQVKPVLARAAPAVRVAAEARN
jgi:hypothetical protein